MANLFGVGQPIIYVKGGTSYTLPKLPLGGRYEDFLPEGKVWQDWQGSKNDRIKYRLKAVYNWGIIEDPDDMDNLIQVLNQPGQKEIKFPSFPIRFGFRVVKLERKNAGGSELYDAVNLEIEGLHLLTMYPHLDMYRMGQELYDCERLAIA